MKSKKVIVVGCGFNRTTELAKVLAEESVNAEIIVCPSSIEIEKQEITKKIEELPKIIDKQFFEPPETRQERRRKDRALKNKFNRKF